MSGHRAVQIVTFEQKSGLTKAFLEEARLKEIIDRGANNLPTIVISIGGVARSGKSFLLNLFVNYLTYLEQNGSDSGWETCSLPVAGVNWAQSRTAVTLGIWMWSRPFIITRSDGSKVGDYKLDLVVKQENLAADFSSANLTNIPEVLLAAVLLVDSQGTGDNRRSDVKLDTLIMYISLQLSSVQVLNVEKYLTSDVMISLQLCADYADVGGIEQQSGAGDSDDFLFQSLAFVIRDYQSDDHYGEDHKAFQEILREVANDDLKKVVMGISKAFRNVTSFNMPYPGSGVVRASFDTKLWQVKDIPGDFLAASKEVIKKLCNLTPSRSSGTCWESGDELLANFKLLKYHLENDDLPQITSPSEALQETILYRAFSNTQKFFSKEFAQGFDTERLRNVADSAQLKAMFDGLVEKTKAHFKKAAKGDKYARTSIWRKYTEMLETTFETAFSGVKIQFDFMQQIRKLEHDNQLVAQKINEQAQVFEQQLGSLNSEIHNNKLKQQEAEQIYQAREESLQSEIGNLHKMVEEANNDEEKERLREEINKHQMETQKMRAENEKSQLEHRHQMEMLTNKMSEMQTSQKREQERHEAETRRLQQEFQQQQDRMRQQERAVKDKSSGPLGFFGDLIGMVLPAAVGGIFSNMGSKMFSKKTPTTE